MKQLLTLLIIFIPSVIYAENNSKSETADFMLKCSSAIDIASNLETDATVREKLTYLKKVYFVIGLELSSKEYAREKYGIFYKELMTGGSGPKNSAKWIDFIRSEVKSCETRAPALQSYIQDAIRTKLSNE